MRTKRIWLSVLILASACVAVWAAGQTEPAAEEAAVTEGPIRELPEFWHTPADYEKATGKKIGEYKEPPYLEDLVADGSLPPVEQRLPEEPLVAEGVEGIGKYSSVMLGAITGTISGAMVDEIDLIAVKHSWTADPYPSVAKSYRKGDSEGRVWIVELRKGLKWSDGEPYTADDGMFWWNDLIMNEDITPNVPGWAQTVSLERIDDYTLRFTFDNPTDFILIRQVNGHGITSYPKHYLEQFHATYTDKADVEKMAKDAGFESWVEYFNNRADYGQIHNLDLPSLCPWTLFQTGEGGLAVHKRNPYYWSVDPAGNQLPYIDERHFIVTPSEEVSQLRALNGDLDYFVTGFGAYTLAKKAEQEGKCKTFISGVTAINAAQVNFNINHQDPALREIFGDKRFRHAVSYAIDRPTINELVYHGISQPWQVAPPESSRFYHQEFAHTAIEYDPERAKGMLDDLGLDKTDSDGFRLRPDGKPLDITFISYPTPETKSIGEYVIDQLKAVGLDVNLRFVDWGLLRSSHAANSYDGALLWQAWATDGGMHLVSGVNDWLPIHNICYWAPLWASWYRSDGAEGEKPPQVLLDALESWKKAGQASDPAEQERLFKKVLDVAADNLWTIGTVQMPGNVAIISNQMRNVPTTSLPYERGDFGRLSTWFKVE